jgi:hypothetical protein
MDRPDPPVARKAHPGLEPVTIRSAGVLTNRPGALFHCGQSGGVGNEYIDQDNDGVSSFSAAP